MNGILYTIYDVMENTAGRRSRVFHVCISVLISVNILLAILETDPAILEQYGDLFAVIDSVSLAIFVGEYATRLVAYRASPDYSKRRFALLRYALSPMMLVDLAVILPFLMPFLAVDARVIRVLRLLRLFAVFKLARVSEPLRTFGYVIRSKSTDLALAFFILFIVLMLASSLMYYVEREAQPEVFTSIPAAMWWGVVTLTTVGYGDVVPATLMGRLIGAGVAVLGIAVFAIPAGIIASAFTEIRRGGDSDMSFCPHCGKSLE